MENLLEKLYKLCITKHSVIQPGKEQLSAICEELYMPVHALNNDYQILKSTIKRHSNENALKFISNYADLSLSTTHVVSTNDTFNIEKIPLGSCEILINLRKINDIRRINKFFELVNNKLPDSGIFIGCSETLELRHKRLLKKYPFLLNRLFLLIDFIFKRVFPKLWFTKKVYFLLTGGRNRIISKAETLGRLYSCGFKVIADHTIGYLYYFVVQKVSRPAYDLNPSYGLLFPMVRKGKNGNIIRVYKFRTMHPFSEYLQEYIYKTNNLDKGGKFKNDFRVTNAGSIMRKFWIDELPMFYNLIKGDLKLVGIRPLSKHFESLYPDYLVKLRQQVKPGLVPPYYADMPKGMEEIFESERKYLTAYHRSPILTDWKYFWKAFANIFFRKARSK